MNTISSTESALTVQRISIAQGSRRNYLLSRIIAYIIGLVLFVFSIRVLCWTFLSFGVNAVSFRASTLPVILLLFLATCKEIYNISTSEYYIEDGVLLGEGVYVDLWNLTDIRYGAHCVYLNKTVLPYIAKPKVFLDTLEVAYYNLTGESLP